MAALADDDVLVITADHGNDPTTPTTDHSREYVPLLISGASVRIRVNLGVRQSYADLGATVTDALGLKLPLHGTSFKSMILSLNE